MRNWYRVGKIWAIDKGRSREYVGGTGRLLAGFLWRRGSQPPADCIGSPLERGQFWADGIRPYKRKESATMEDWKKRGFVRQFRQLSDQEKDEFLSVTDKCRKIRNAELCADVLKAAAGQADLRRKYTVEISGELFVMLPLKMLEKML